MLLTAGADIINDISGGAGDANMIPVAGGLGAPMIFMHMRGTVVVGVREMCLCAPALSAVAWFCPLSPCSKGWLVSTEA